ncbi:MAG: PAS-domain containing protein [Sphingomicrobium sp.]
MNLPPALIALGAVTVLWLLLAAAVTVFATRRLKLAYSILDIARTNSALLRRTPARPVILHADDSLEVDRELVRQLGLKDGVRKLVDLLGPGGGLHPDDTIVIAGQIDAARASALSFTAKVRASGSDRVFEVRGEPAAHEPRGTFILWFYDISAPEAEKDQVSARLKQSEAALNSLTQLIEAAPFPMWYRGPDLRLGLVNQAFVQAVEGGDSAAVIERQLELIDAPGEEGPVAYARAAQEQKQVMARMQPAIIRDERRMLRLVDVPLSSGAVAGFAVDVQDIEDARTELARHIESQRGLADRMTAGTAQFDADRSLGFFNRSFATMCALDPDWLAERPEFDRVIERMRENQRLPEVRDFPAWREERRAWFTSPDEAIAEEWTLPNGDHIRVVAQPLPDGGLRLFLEDRTEQLRLASARDTLLRVRAATFNNLFEAISVFASDGRLYLWNSRFVEDWTLEEEWLSTHPGVDDLVLVLARKLTDPAAAAQIREMVRKSTNERESSTGRLSMTDGREFQFAAVPLPDGNALLTLVDVTDSSRIEAALRERATALEQADRIKTDFVANMSYELRTPLTSIGGFAELLEGGYAGKLTAKGVDYTRAILESVERLSKLIDNVLDLTAADSTAIVLERERVDIAGLCRAAIDKAGPRAKEKVQALEAKISEDAGFVSGDARRLRETLEHVLYNAIAYTDRGGQISLTAGGDGERAKVEIRDNGMGIAAADLPRIFDRFDRVEQEGVRGEAALGLGLPLTRQFIEAHGGTVVVESEEGAGTCVTLSIPRGADDPR